jgi:flavodoxin short chain
MLKIIIIYWSGTGNTEIIANTIAKNLKVNNEVNVRNVSSISGDYFNDNWDLCFLGCPAMGIESLEEDEFRPFFDKIKFHLRSKYLALFGSYAWGEGLWMRKWMDECLNIGSLLMSDGFIVKSTPSSIDLKNCLDFCNKVIDKVDHYVN